LKIAIIGSSCVGPVLGPSPADVGHTAACLGKDASEISEAQAAPMLLDFQNIYSREEVAGRDFTNSGIACGLWACSSSAIERGRVACA
jgi:UDP-glucose 6-dehydrogenase